MDLLAEAHTVDGKVTPEHLQEIMNLTSEPVYIITYNRWTRDSRPDPFSGVCGGSWKEYGRDYKLKDGVLELFPYLQKFAHWDRLFKLIEGTTCYEIQNQEDLAWLMKKNKNYLRKCALK